MEHVWKSHKKSGADLLYISVYVYNIYILYLQKVRNFAQLCTPAEFKKKSTGYNDANRCSNNGTTWRTKAFR